MPSGCVTTTSVSTCCPGYELQIRPQFALGLQASHLPLDLSARQQHRVVWYSASTMAS